MLAFKVWIRGGKESIPAPFGAISDPCFPWTPKENCRRLTVYLGGRIRPRATLRPPRTRLSIRPPRNALHQDLAQDVQSLSGTKPFVMPPRFSVLFNTVFGPRWTGWREGVHFGGPCQPNLNIQVIQNSNGVPHLLTRHISKPLILI